MANKKELIHDFLRSTITIVPDSRHGRSCDECVLTKDRCDNICLTAGTRYHVTKEVTYTRWQVIKRFFNNLFFNHF